jgi:hypothetical protein
MTPSVASPSSRCGDVKALSEKVMMNQIKSSQRRRVLVSARRSPAARARVELLVNTNGCLRVRVRAHARACVGRMIVLMSRRSTGRCVRVL